MANSPASKKNLVNINLLIKEDLGESFSDQLLSWALTYGRYIIIITQIVVLSVFFLRFKLDRDHTDLKESVSQKQAIVESVTDLENEIRQVQTKLAFIKQISLNQDSSLRVLRFLQDHTPSDNTFSNLSLNSEKISLSASASNLRSFNFFLLQLQQDKKFSEVTVEDLTRRPDGKVEFKINAKINIKEFI